MRIKNILTASSVLFALICFTLSVVYYLKGFYSPLIPVCWVLSMVILLLAFYPLGFTYNLKNKFLKNKNKILFSIIVFFLLTTVFFVSRFWNFNTAPWNQDGIFDDAAWDVHFYMNNVLDGKPFQAAIFSADFAAASRETFYHYAMGAFFSLFGYDLLTFNIFLMVLGYLAFIFTCLLIQRLFNNYFITAISGLMLNFLPTAFIQSFAGHRYVIAAPLLMMCLYFLYTGFSDKSNFKIVLGSIFAGLCTASAIMGRQLLIGLAAAAVCLILFNRKKVLTKANIRMAVLFVLGVAITCVPLAAYILLRREEYFCNEGLFSSLLFDSLKTNGLMKTLSIYLTEMQKFFFSPSYGDRMFTPEFLPIPIPYYLFLIPGIVIAFVKKHYSIILIPAVALAVALVASAHGYGYRDYRIVHVHPLFIVTMAFTINSLCQALTHLVKTHVLKLMDIQKIMRYVVYPVIIAVTLTGLVPCLNYLQSKSKDSESVYFLEKREVYPARFLRDIVAGVPSPSPYFKRNEFLKLANVPEPDYDTFVCPLLGSAVTNMFLYAYDKAKSFSFVGNSQYTELSQEDILTRNKNAIAEYEKTNKNLKLVWQVIDDEQIQGVIRKFAPLKSLGSDERKSFTINGSNYNFYILNIKNQNIDEFKEQVAKFTLN